MLSAVGTRGGGIGGIGGGMIHDRNITSNATRAFECHNKGEGHGTMLLCLAGAGVMANVSLAALIMARRSLRRWSSGLLLHGTIVDGARAALLLPLGYSVFRCQPITRCSLLDTAFLLLATVTSLNLLTASLSDAPLLPPPVLVPSLLQSAGFSRSASHFASPLYSKGEGYHSEYYDDDANLLAETTAMPDSPQCVLFGTFMVWFAALTINLGPTFLSGALAAQADVAPTSPSCPLVRGPARHAVLNALWAGVNLLCVALAGAHLRKLKKDLSRARLGLLAAAGAGLAGMAGIIPNKLGPASSLGPSSSFPSSTKTASTLAGGGQGSSSVTGHSAATPAELDSLIRQVQKNGRCHIRTLGTLAVVNLVCWVPLYVVALVAPVGTPTLEDPTPMTYEWTLLAAFAHSVIHPLSLLMLHHPLRDGLKHCLIEWCCCVCLWLGMEFELPVSDGHGGSGRVSRKRVGLDFSHELSNDNQTICSSYPRTSFSRSSHPHPGPGGIHRSVGDLVHIPGSGSILKMKRATSLKSDRLLGSAGGYDGDPSSPTIAFAEDMLPPPPLPPAHAVFRKQISLEQMSPTSEDNRW